MIRPAVVAPAAVEEGIAKTLRAFADRLVHLVLLVARRACRHQAQRDGALPMGIGTV